MPGSRPRLASKKFLKEAPDGKEIKRLLNEMQDLGDRSMVIVGGAVFAESFRRFVESRMRKDLHPEDRNRMFDSGQGGFIATLDAQLRIAYALGWIEVEFFEDALIIQAIRNVFAHSFHELSFSNTEIQADCQKLKLRLPPKPEQSSRDKPIEFLQFRNWIFVWTYWLSALTASPPPLPASDMGLPFALSLEKVLPAMTDLFNLGGQYIENNYGTSRGK